MGWCWVSGLPDCFGADVQMYRDMGDVGCALYHDHHHYHVISGSRITG